MGRLVGLELYNFKSYKGTVNVDFGDSNFTSIIGPNGSGKSNLMDAISFVLGIRSSSLRSSALKDLIYRDIISRENTPTETDNDENENRTAYVKAFYEYDGKVVELMRLISRFGDTSYKLDGNTVTYKEYSQFLESQNILIKAKNFLVFQGDVEQIASQSPLGLTKLIEEVSGSMQYKKEYEELKDQYDKICQASTESIKKRRRIHAELKTYKEGMSRDEEYRKYVQKKKRVQTNLSLWQLYHMEDERYQCLQKLEESQNDVDVIREKLEAEEKNLEVFKKALSKEAVLLTKKKNHIRSISKEKEKAESDLKVVKIPQNASINRLKNLDKRVVSLQKDLEREEANLEKYKHQLKVVTDSKNAFEQEILSKSKNNNKFTLSEDDLKLYDELKGEYLNNGGIEIEDTLNLLDNKKEEITADLKIINDKVEISKQRIEEELVTKKEEQEAKIRDSTLLLNEKNDLHSHKLDELRKTQKDIEYWNNKEFDLNHKLRDTLVKLDDLNATQRESNKERKLRENVAMLKRFFPGVRGLVHELCKPKRDKYKLAVSTVLGKNFDSVIVDSLSVAQECISFLKKQRTGVISFIPLDTIDAATPRMPVPESETYTLAINTVEYKDDLVRAMYYVCSDTIICDNLDIARDLKWNKNANVKIVTLDGALINKTGLMTGGITSDSANRWDKDEYQSLLDLKDKLIVDVEEAANKSRQSTLIARELEVSLSSLTSEISYIRTQITQTKRAVEETETEINHHNNLIDREFIPQVKDLENKISGLEDEIRDWNTKREALQEKCFARLTEKVGFTMKDYESHTGEMIRKQTKELQILQKQILNLENKVEFETGRCNATKDRLQNVQETKNSVQHELNELVDQEKSIKLSIETLEGELDGKNEELKSIKAAFDSKQKDASATEDIISEYNNRLASIESDRNEIKDDITRLDLEKMSILKNCQVSGIIVPVVSEVGLEELPASKVDDEAIEIAKKIEIDFSKLPRKYKEATSAAVKQDLNNQIRDIDDVLEELQPNARAVERFDDAKSRFDEVDKETEGLKTEERKVFDEFLKVKQKRKELFENAFEKINEHLDAIYSELTRNVNSTSILGGGSASMTIEDEDEPFNAGIRYHATPPMKRFKDMEYLSGGEKTVAALALLFAINSYNPSPFFILDEVDAALDISNVQRIAAYIRRHGNPDLQFIVISLKNTMFEKSDALVGVFRQQQENSSKIVTLDLNQYAT